MTPTIPPTETPRTDAEEDSLHGGTSSNWVPAGFARELERELNLCLAKNTEYQADVIRIAGELILLRQELESQRPKGYLKQEQVTAYLLHWREYCGQLEAQIVERDVNISILSERLYTAEALLESLITFQIVEVAGSKLHKDIQQFLKFKS